MSCWRGKILQLLKGFRANCSTLMHCNSSLQSSGSNSCTNFVNHIFFTLWIHHTIKLLIESEVRSLGFALSCIIFLPFSMFRMWSQWKKLAKSCNYVIGVRFHFLWSPNLWPKQEIPANATLNWCNISSSGLKQIWNKTSKKFYHFCFWQCHALTSGVQSTDLAVNLTWTQKCGHCHVKEGNSLRS
jgi:hypothetical protein